MFWYLPMIKVAVDIARYVSIGEPQDGGEQGFYYKGKHVCDIPVLEPPHPRPFLWAAPVGEKER